MNNKIKFLRGTSDEYAVAEKDSDTIYFTTDDGKLYIGDKEVSGSDITIDDTLSDTSTNPVQNKVVKQAIDNKADKTVATTSANGLMSAADKTKLDGADDTYALKSKYGDTTINVGRKAGTTVGNHSTAEGYDTTASGNYSHAEGFMTTASGHMSHAEGASTTARGNYSHAEGFMTTASGDYSHAGGRYTKALHMNEVAYGQYNESNDDTLFSVGDGTADSARHNAFEITTTGGKLHDKDIATTDLIPTELPANGGNADTVDGLHANEFIKVNSYDGYDCNTLYDAGLYLCSGQATNTPNDLKYGSLFVMPYRKPYGNLGPDYCAQIFIPNGDADDKSLWYRTSLQNTWNEWKRSCDGGNADYATNAGNAEKLGGLDASAYSTSIIKSVTFSAATTNGYIWTGIPFPKYVIGVDLGHFDVIAQFYKGNHVDAARAEWAMMFFSKDDVTTPLNGSFNGVIYYID